MPVLLVAYDSKKQEDNYSAFYNIIKHYFHIKLSTFSYAIYTSEPPSFVYEKFKTFIQKNDRLYVIKLDKPWSGYGPIENRDWLMRHF